MVQWLFLYLNHLRLLLWYCLSVYLLATVLSHKSPNTFRDVLLNTFLSISILCHQRHHYYRLSFSKHVPHNFTIFKFMNYFHNFLPFFRVCVRPIPTTNTNPSLHICFVWVWIMKFFVAHMQSLRLNPLWAFSSNNEKNET